MSKKEKEKTSLLLYDGLEDENLGGLKGGEGHGENIKADLHFIRQKFAQKKEKCSTPAIFEDTHKETEEDGGGKKLPAQYGVALNQVESQVLDGIFKKFTETDYQGDIQMTKERYAKQYQYPTDTLQAYKNVTFIPVLRLGQRELARISGMSEEYRQKAVEALKKLSREPYVFIWHRLVYDKKGRPMMDSRTHEYVKERVTEVSSILRTQEVADEAGNFKYYEISPSAALIDQIDNYFLIMPANWREEVKQITGKRESDYTYKFLEWLRMNFEEIRRHNAKPGNKGKQRPYVIKRTWEQVAEQLMMPSSIAKKNRARARNIIQRAYEVAYMLKYLERPVENDGYNDVIVMNVDKYPQPSHDAGK